MNVRSGIPQVLAAGTCFGFLGIFAKLGFSLGFSVGELLTFRFLVAAVVLGLFLGLFQRRNFNMSSGQILTSILLGILGYAVFSTLYFESIKGITVGLAALLLFTFPLFVNLGAWLFLKEPMGRLRLLSLLFSSCGLVFLVWGDWKVQEIASVFFGLGAAISYAGYVLVSGRVQKNVPPLISSFFVISSAGLVLALINQPKWSKLIEIGPQGLMLIFGIALICTIFPLTLFLSGLQRMPSSKASILVTIEPVVASLAGAFIFGELMTPLQIFGATLILASMLMQSFDPGPSESLF